MRSALVVAFLAVVYTYGGGYLFKVALVLGSGPRDEAVGDAPGLPTDAKARVGMFTGKRALVVGGTRGIVFAQCFLPVLHNRTNGVR